MVSCAGCQKPLSSLELAARCRTCLLPYHRGCVSLSRTALIDKDWTGPCCMKTAPKKDSTPARPKSMSESLHIATSEAGGPSKSPVSFGTPVTSPLPRPVSDLMRDEIKEFVGEIREFRKEVTELRAILAGVTTRLTSLEGRIVALESREPTAAVSSATVELERTVDSLRQELNDRDQEALLADLDIGQLPEARGENTVHTVLTLAVRLGVTLDERDVVFAERVGVPPAAAAAEASSAGRPRRLIVRLARRHLRDELLRAARVRRNIVAPDQTQTLHRVYVNERLTRQNRQLFHRAREECRAGHWRFAWTKRGRVYVRQSDTSQAYVVRSIPDLERILMKDRKTSASENF